MSEDIANKKCRPFLKGLSNVLNPQTYKQSHKPTVVQGGLMDPPPLGFSLCYNSLLESVRCALQDEDTLWVATLLGAGDVIQNGCHIGRHIGFY